MKALRGLSWAEGLGRRKSKMHTCSLLIDQIKLQNDAPGKTWTTRRHASRSAYAYTLSAGTPWDIWAKLCKGDLARRRIFWGLAQGLGRLRGATFACQLAIHRRLRLREIGNCGLGEDLSTNELLVADLV